MQGIETAWDRLVENGTFKPDEGLCVLILNASARHGNPGLATAVLAHFTALGIQGREYHYAPVLEAFCATGSLPEALQILDTMRTHGGVEPTLMTARPLVESMVSRRDIKWVDAGFDALEALHIKGQRIDPAAFNAVLKAAAEYGDLKRAVVIFRQAESFDVKPNVETFNTLLSACVKAGAKDQAEIVKKDMESQLGATTKDADTFQHLIELYLSQENYEPAFQYLEEMKAARHRPPLSVYEGMVRKCWQASDERFRLVLEEMQLGGYKPSRGLIEFLGGGNKASADRTGEVGAPREKSRRAGVASRRGSAAEGARKR
jgi:pentatricopeptide repeat protein